jgi:cell wall-associated NlpC family hydrolase
MRKEGEQQKLSFRKPVVMALAALAMLTFTIAPAHATTLNRNPLRITAYEYAVAQAGKQYCWGGAGPSCYDCSGLVYEAYLRVHVDLGRTTYDMLDSADLVRISAAQARRGDLAFFGSGHVELVDHGPVTFGAHTTGQLIGWITTNSAWHPTAYYRVRGAGRR